MKCGSNLLSLLRDSNAAWFGLRLGRGEWETEKFLLGVLVPLLPS